MALQDSSVIFACPIGWNGEQFVTDRLKELCQCAGAAELSLCDSQSDEFGKVLVGEFLIDTKYYTAETQLCIGNASVLSNSKFMSRVEAMLLFYDSESPTGFALLKQVERAMRKLRIDVDIRLLVSECVKKNRGELTAWTAEHDFELIELTFDKEDSPNDKEASNSDSEEEPEYFKEKFGIERVLEALQCHRWSSATYKQTQRTGATAAAAVESDSEPENKASDDPKANGSQTPASATHETSTVTQQVTNTNGTSSAHAHKNEDEDENEREADEFESLFEKFGEMKRVAASLTGDERLEYAERMTTMFWNALGLQADRHGSGSHSDSDHDSD